MPGEGERQRRVAIALLATGAVLRIWQYAANTSFWLDEIAVALNVDALPLGKLLTEPLALDQVAPKGFLAIEKLATLALGTNELAFRLYALLCGLAALGLFWRLGSRAVGGRAALVALALFAIAPPLIRYSAEAKQYGGDVAGTIAVTLLAIRLFEEEPTARRCLLSGLAGASIAFFSQASVLAMAGIGAVLVGRWLVRRDRHAAMPAMLTVPIWAAASAAAILLTERTVTPETREFMHWFWSRTGFPPLPFQLGTTLAWIADRVEQIFSFEQTLRYPFGAVYALALVGGFAALWRMRGPWIASLIYAPLLVAIAAAVARRYPFDRRLLLFVVPGVLIGVAATIETLAQLAARRRRELGWALVALALVPPAFAIVRMPPPYHVETYKPVFAYLAAHRNKTEPLYVSRSAGLAAAWYGPASGVSSADYILGACDRDDPRAYLRDVDRFRGLARVWVLTSAVTPLQPPQRNLARYLDAIGTRGEGLTVPTAFFGPATVYPYDLSDPARLRTASADDFPVEPMMASFRPGCRGPLGTSR
jgi:hypothetical protein